MSGLFITFEGSDGSGKSTQINLLAEYLAEKGEGALITREPGGTRIGDKIRELLLDPSNSEMDDRTEMFLYAASRAQHVSEVIKPALEAGKMVISDRFVDSSYVYQGGARGLGEAVTEVNKYAIDDCEPDVTFLLLLDPEISQERMQMQSRSQDRIEAEGISYQSKVTEAYRALAGKYPKRMFIIDASAGVEEIQGQIRAKVDDLLKGLDSGSSPE
jgi:dTMP kinase